MGPLILSIATEEGRRAAADTLRRQEVIAYPTDTLYGVGGDARSPRAAQRTFDAKGREIGKGVPVLLPDVSSARELVRAWPPAADALAAAFWPGALTLVLPASRAIPELICTGDTVALRVPGHALLRVLMAEAGVPLIGTSANRSGEPAALTAHEAAQMLGTGVSLVLDGGRVGGQPSTVVAVEEASIRILRPGAVTVEQIRSCLAGSGMGLSPER